METKQGLYYAGRIWIVIAKFCYQYNIDIFLTLEICTNITNVDPDCNFKTSVVQVMHLQVWLKTDGKKSHFHPSVFFVFVSYFDLYRNRTRNRMCVSGSGTKKGMCVSRSGTGNGREISAHICGILFFDGDIPFSTYTKQVQLIKPACYNIEPSPTTS